MVYVVCQTKRCQQTYPIDYLIEIKKETKNVTCEKCGGILIDKNGRGNLSKHPHVIHVIDDEYNEKIRQEEIQRKRQEFDRLEDDINRLEKETEI